MTKCALEGSVSDDLLVRTWFRWHWILELLFNPPRAVIMMLFQMSIPMTYWAFSVVLVQLFTKLLISPCLVDWALLVRVPKSSALLALCSPNVFG